MGFRIILIKQFKKFIQNIGVFMTINFYLGAPNRKDESRIYIYLRGIDNEPDYRKVIKIPTAKYLESKYWNNKEQIVRKNFNLHLEYNNKLLEDKSKILFVIAYLITNKLQKIYYAIIIHF